jgi:hypothetical protein
MRRRVLGLFISMDGIVRAEYLSIDKREVEFIDGNHPYLPSAIYRDIDGVGPPLYICWHGRTFPEGVKADRQIEEAVIKEAFHMTQHKLKPLMSRRFWRAFWHYGVMFFKACLIGFLVAFAALVLRVVVF